MILSLDCKNGKTSIMLNGMPLDGLLSYSLSCDNARAPIVFRCEMRIQSELHVSVNGVADNRSSDICEGSE